MLRSLGQGLLLRSLRSLSWPCSLCSPVSGELSLRQASALPQPRATSTQQSQWSSLRSPFCLATARDEVIKVLLAGLFTVGFSVQGIPSWRAGRSRTLSFSFAVLFILWIAFHSTLISSRALTFCCPLYAISTVSFGCSSVRGGHFQVVFHEKKNASHDFSAPYRTIFVCLEKCFDS